MATSSSDGKPSPPPKSRKLLVLLVVALLVLAGGGGAAYYFFVARNHSAAAAPPAPPPDPIFVALEPFTVNLQAEGKSRFLHVGMSLKVDDAASQEMITKFLPEVRSRILSTLSNRQADQLLTPQQKAALSAELLAALTQPFAPNRPPAKIASIMLTSFIVQ